MEKTFKDLKFTPKNKKFIQICSSNGWIYALGEDGNVWYKADNYYRGEKEPWQITNMDKVYQDR
jgi:hypothetical protein